MAVDSTGTVPLIRAVRRHPTLQRRSKGCSAESRYAFECHHKEADRKRFRSADVVCTGTHAERDKRPDRYVVASVRDAKDDERFPLFTAAIRGARPTISSQWEPRYVESNTC